MLSCAKPYFLKDKKLYVGCGTCVCCARKRSSAWALRVVKDIETCRKKDNKKTRSCAPGCFCSTDGIYYITLSYSGKYLPIKLSEKGKVIRGEGDGFLYRKDLQNFKKRLRVNIERKYGVTGVRILASGEYGPNNTHRPHFHMIVWNCPQVEYKKFLDLVKKSWSVYDRSSKTSELIGNVNVQSVIKPGDVASYVAKVTSYVSKDGVSAYCKQPGETNAQFCKRTGKLTVPFVSASHGVGLDYFTENANEISRLGFCNDKGFKVSIPSFFLDKVAFLVGRDHFKYKVDRFLSYCTKKGLDLGNLLLKDNRIAVYDYLYFKSLLRAYKRTYYSRLVRALDKCGVFRDLRSKFLNGHFPVASFCYVDSIAKFLFEYGDRYASYSDFVVKHQFFVDILEKSVSVHQYNRLMKLIHLEDGKEDIVQRYKNALEKEKISAQRSAMRQMERKSYESHYSFV